MLHLVKQVVAFIIGQLQEVTQVKIELPSTSLILRSILTWHTKVEEWLIMLNCIHIHTMKEILLMVS